MSDGDSRIWKEVGGDIRELEKESVAWRSSSIATMNPIFQIDPFHKDMKIQRALNESAIDDDDEDDAWSDVSV
jgi:hypothetical protein